MYEIPTYYYNIIIYQFQIHLQLLYYAFVLSTYLVLYCIKRNNPTYLFIVGIVINVLM